jgi:ankyrin repeat protein
MAAFLFARALNKTEEFHLASNVDGVGAFDDLVLKYRLRDTDIWKTCLIQFKHKKKRGTLQRCSLTEMSGDFSLLKYFTSYCQIERESCIEGNLKFCGPFSTFEFIIYTNARMKSNSSLQGGDSDPLSILSSGLNYGKYITFDETYDRDIYEFFKGLSRDHCLGESDFSPFQKFLSKVKIFHSQTNEESLQPLIEKELQYACKASLTVAKSIYTKFEGDFRKWWGKSGNVVWLSKNSQLWHDVEKYFITEIREISETEFQETLGCGILFNQQHIQRFSAAIKQHTFLNIITNSNIRTLHKLKTYQAVNYLGYANSLFIGLKSLMIRRKEIRKLWPCRWSAVLVIDCDCDGNVADTLLDILQKNFDCEKGSDHSDGNMAATLVDILQKYQQKVILISPQQRTNLASSLREKLGNTYADYEDNCVLSDLDEKSQKQILERTVNFQGTHVALQTLIGTDPPEIIKTHIGSELISVLLYSEAKLCVGRNLSAPSKNYVQRSLNRQVCLKSDILKATDSNITFAVSGLEADQLKQYLPAGEKMYEFEGKKNNPFRIVADFSEPGLSAEWETMKSHHKIGQKIKPEEVRYIILGNLNPESNFRELKALCTNVHWIHMEDGAFLWKDSNCNIDIIRRYIDKKYKKYDTRSLIGHSDKTMLLVAEPGMGKSTFLSHMEHEIKKCDPSVWVLRINLHEHTDAFDNIEFEKECIDKCKEFLWNAVHSREQNALTLEKRIFLQALEKRGKVVIILDGFDEISPDYSPKIETLIREVQEKIAPTLWVSSRSSYRLNLEDVMMKFAFTLQPFKRQNQIDFLEKCWNKSIDVFKPGSIRAFAKKLIGLCSKRFNDKGGKFTGIPLQIMMLGEAFVEEAKNHCSNEDISLPEKFNVLALFQKFTEKKCDIYFSEKNSMDCSKPKTKRDRKSYVEKHMISALRSLFSPSRFKRLWSVGNAASLENMNEFLQSGEALQFGIITEITDGKPRFIHRLVAEYFAAKWFTENFRNCGSFILKNLFNSTYESTRNIFDRMLAEESEIHIALFNNDIRALNDFLKEGKDVNIVDKGGRTALHLAASYNSPLTQTLLSVPNVDASVVDEVLKGTPLRYAERTRSWMAMELLLQNGAKTDDPESPSWRTESWGQAALWECAQKGYKKLLEFVLNCGTDVNASVGVPKSLQEKCTLLHIASLCNQVEIVRFLLERGADLNSRNANDDTAFHFAARSGNVDIMKLLIDKGISANLTNTPANTPLQLSPASSNLVATRVFVKIEAALNKTNKSGLSPLMMAAYNGKLEAVRYLIERGADINLCTNTNKSALLLAVEGKQFHMVRLLLENGADVNVGNVPWDMRPLVRAILMQNFPVVKHLVESGADFNLCTTDGRRSALHAAAFVGNLEITDYLIDAGADLNWRDFNGFTPLIIAISNGKTKLALHLVEKGADANIQDFKKRTPLYHAVRRNNLKCTKHLVQFAADVNLRRHRTVTAIEMAIKLERTQIVKYLVGTVADVNLLVLGERRMSALHAAAFVGNVEIADCLIAAGSHLDCRDSEDFTPLAIAVIKNRTKLAVHLMKKGADVNIPDFKERTPLHHAVLMNNLKCTKHLVHFGAINHRGHRNVAAGSHLNCRDSEGFTPLAIAVINNNTKLALHLMKKGADVNIPDFEQRTPLYHAAREHNLKMYKKIAAVRCCYTSSET